MGGVSVRDVDVSVLRFPAPRGKDLMIIITPLDLPGFGSMCVCSADGLYILGSIGKGIYWASQSLAY